MLQRNLCCTYRNNLHNPINPNRLLFISNRFIMGAHAFKGGLSPISIRKGIATGIQGGVEFGTLTRDGECLNVGICRMTSEESTIFYFEKQSRKCRRAAATFSVHPDGGLQMDFPKAGMLPCTERAVFGQGLFPVPEGYLIPVHLKNQFPGECPEYIPPGAYSIEDLGHSYRVVFGTPAKAI